MLLYAGGHFGHDLDFDSALKKQKFDISYLSDIEKISDNIQNLYTGQILRHIIHHVDLKHLEWLKIFCF
ncbi:hypothetical protein BpHYR1_049766 [Brachionus plicatilis]|uniref:Uncharacterized protein n=1 Tax=Brachionus plicatilis TaxID=10195 RepID=A0A3M7P0R8_BRAPC|nr:hypothetical protein BpHYR1_049766 [Brachionus plicatilis]